MSASDLPANYPVEDLPMTYPVEDVTKMDDPDLIEERRRIRETLEHDPLHEISPEMRHRFRQLDDEFINRARAAWAAS